MHKLRFRQVHLDFHTSPAIKNIGVEFGKKQWQQSLKMGHVDSITCFAKCHHGWSYHNTKIGKQHPHLKFDLLRAQYDATKELDIKMPISLEKIKKNLHCELDPDSSSVECTGTRIASSFRRVSGDKKPGVSDFCIIKQHCKKTQH